MLAPYLLLIEDDQDDVQFTLRTLRVNRCPLITRVVYDGVQALEFLRNAGSLPVAVLLNSNLPRWDGDEVLRLLRADKRTENLPVVLMTGTEDECRRMSTGSNASAATADACLTKPLQWTALSQAFRRLGLLGSAESNLGRGFRVRASDMRLS